MLLFIAARERLGSGRRGLLTMATSINTSLHVENDAKFYDIGACRPATIALNIAAGGSSYANIFISPAKAIELARWLIEQASECGVEAEAAAPLSAPLSATMPVAANAGGVGEWGL